jgi:hypothetical protein
MKQHEREYFISRIRSGTLTLKKYDITLKVLTPTVEQDYEACEVFSQSYDESYIGGIMNEEEMLDWMVEQGLWTENDDKKVKGLKDDIERLKVEIFRASHKEQLRKQIRKYLRAGEEQLLDCLAKKNMYTGNTREGIASVAKWRYVIMNCTFVNGKLYDFKDLSLDYVLSSYQESILREVDLRELCNHDPWKSLWTIHGGNSHYLFCNTNREMTQDQKTLVVWSKIYDSVQESVDCPSDDVLDDADMLDGWFIVQRKKREKEKAEQDFEESVGSDKIKNADEVFVMANTDNDRNRVESMNDLTGSMIIKQRKALIDKRGGVTQGEFMDEKLKQRRESNKQYKDKFGGSNG